MLHIRGAVDDMRESIAVLSDNLELVRGDWIIKAQRWVEVARCAGKHIRAAVPPPKANTHVGKPYSKLRSEPLLRCLKCDGLVWLADLETHLYRAHQIDERHPDKVHMYYAETEHDVLHRANGDDADDCVLWETGVSE